MSTKSKSKTTKTGSVTKSGKTGPSKKSVLTKSTKSTKNTNKSPKSKKTGETVATDTSIIRSTKSGKSTNSRYGFTKRKATVSEDSIRRGMSTRGGSSYAQSTFVKPPPSKKPKIIAGVVVVAIILFIILFVVLYFVLLEKEKLPSGPPTSLNTEISKQCQDKFGKCWYSKLKYISNCSTMPCSSMTVEPYLNEENITQQIRTFKLSFVYNEVISYTVPTNFTPCGVNQNGTNVTGWCENGVCKTGGDTKKELELREDIKSYDEYSTENGTWDNSAECINGLNATEKAQTINWKKYLDRTQCVTSENICNKFRLSFRSCSAPVRGGKLCWEASVSGNIGKVTDWPVQIDDGEQCTNCKVPDERPVDCQDKSLMDKCIFHEDDFEQVNEVSDFRQCCVPGREGKTGRCLLGACIFRD